MANRSFLFWKSLDSHETIVLETVCSELQRHSSLVERNGFVAVRLHDAYHAQIGMRANALYASTTCVLLSVWGDFLREVPLG